MPASKLTRVRSDGFSKSIASTRPGRIGSRRPFSNFAFRSSAIEKIRSISAELKLGQRNQVSHGYPLRRCRYCRCLIASARMSQPSLACASVRFIDGQQPNDRVVGAVDQQPAVHARLDDRRALDASSTPIIRPDDADLLDQVALLLAVLPAAS